MLPKVFIGSSVRSLPIARAIQANLEAQDAPAEATVWDQGIFEPNVHTLTSLLTTLPHFGFAVFVFSPDDIAQIRGEVELVVRDNVVFEYGLATGILGQQRTFYVCTLYPTANRYTVDNTR